MDSRGPASETTTPVAATAAAAAQSPRLTRLIVRSRKGTLGQRQFVLEQDPGEVPGLEDGRPPPPPQLRLRLYAQRIPSRTANILISQDPLDFVRPKGDRGATCIAKVRSGSYGAHGGGGSSSSSSSSRRRKKKDTADLYTIVQLRRAKDRRSVCHRRAAVSFRQGCLHVAVPTADWECRLQSERAGESARRDGARGTVEGKGGKDDQRGGAEGKVDGHVGEVTDALENEGARWDSVLRSFRRMLISGSCWCRCGVLDLLWGAYSSSRARVCVCFDSASRATGRYATRPSIEAAFALCIHHQRNVCRFDAHCLVVSRSRESFGGGPRETARATSAGCRRVQPQKLCLVVGAAEGRFCCCVPCQPFDVATAAVGKGMRGGFGHRGRTRLSH